MSTVRKAVTKTVTLVMDTVTETAVNNATLVTDTLVEIPSDWFAVICVIGVIFGFCVFAGIAQIVGSWSTRHQYEDIGSSGGIVASPEVPKEVVVDNCALPGITGQRASQKDKNDNHNETYTRNNEYGEFA